MIILGRWRWVVVSAVPCVAAGLLFLTGLVRPVFEAHSIVSLMPGSASLNEELKYVRIDQIQTKMAALQKKSPPTVRMDRSGSPSTIVLAAQAYTATVARDAAQATAQLLVDESLARQKSDLLHLQNDLEAQTAVLTPRLQALVVDQDNASILLRRLAHRHGRKNVVMHGDAADHLNAVGRQITELHMQELLLTQRTQALLQRKENVVSHWRLSQVAEKPSFPLRVQGWPLGVGVIFVVGLASFFLIKRKDEEPAVAAIPTPLFKPTELKVVSPNPPETEAVAIKEDALPDDPLTRQASMLFERWLELTRLLYEPAVEPPRGIFERVSPLLTETMEFLDTHHAVMTRYLGQSNIPNALPVHVARTVLMVILAAQEANAGAEHRVGMAMAALFHDLAMVPRSGSDWADIGSEVGRLSAALLQKIPGLTPQILTMTQDILIGMDEYPMNVWQNFPRSKTLESFSKLLRHTDRFEKVMQKQKARVGRRLNQRAAS